jgi:hypothetical protein
MAINDLVRQSIIKFCSEFIKHPYLCYTEHGQHALFYTQLYNSLPITERYTIWQEQKLGVIQKEYPTAGNLGKSKRQHWDIAVIKTPAESTAKNRTSYDYLKLAAVVEFGMNEAMEHLTDDIERICHHDANLEFGFIVHLYRLSEPGSLLFSKRDWSSNSTCILPIEQVKKLSMDKPVEIYYGRADSTGKFTSGVWHIHQGKVISL